MHACMHCSIDDGITLQKNMHNVITFENMHACMHLHEQLRGAAASS